MTEANPIAIHDSDSQISRDIHIVNPLGSDSAGSQQDISKANCQRILNEHDPVMVSWCDPNITYSRGNTGIDRKLGGGGEGVAWLAMDMTTKRRCVVKVFKTGSKNEFARLTEDLTFNHDRLVSLHATFLSDTLGHFLFFEYRRSQPTYRPVYTIWEGDT